MKNKKSIIYILAVFIIGVLIGGFIISTANKDKSNDVVIESRTKNNNEVGSSEEKNTHKIDESMYSLETTEDNIISKELKGEYLDKLVTIALQQEEFSVNLTGVDSSSEVYLINPNNGEMMPLKYEDGRFSAKVKLDKDITYGIIINYKLSGSIRVVEDLNAIDKDQLFRDILISMGCGL